jgi:DNA polymerase
MAQTLGVELPEDDLQGIIDAWRQASPNIVKFWEEANASAKKAIRERRRVDCGKVAFEGIMTGMLFIELPSKRKLAYVNPGFGKNKFGSESIVYQGMNQTTKKWERLETYGGKLTENIVQAIARDCLALAMSRLTAARYKIVAHVHDEVIIETTEGTEKIDAIMKREVPWALGLPMDADGYVTRYYKKDG